jgi:predicted PurR-regulated permease PerM
MSARLDPRDGLAPVHAWLADLRPCVRLGTVALIVTLLYWAQAVLIPVALACLLTFLLSPVASALDRRGLGRLPSVLVVALLTFALAGSAGWLLARQLSTLAGELPKYETNIRHRIADIRGLGSGGSVEKVQHTVKEVVGEIQKAEPAAQRRDKPLAVVVEPPSSFTVNLPGILQALGAAGMVALLVIFMLLERQALRNRLIRLVGYRWITATTKALDEAAARISRYLLMQCIVNGSFGLAVGIGLLLLGVPYAPLWAFLAGALRFIPYVGTWGAALLPIAVSLATSPGLGQPLMVAGLFVVLELCTYMGLEPWIYGQSVGLSPVALLVAVIFWTWLWGPVGLLLATPLTVCLIVLGKHLPAMGFLVVLMGDEPVLDARARYYQRLLARDQDEASDVVEEYVKENPPESVYDEVLLPALYYTKKDRERESITDDDVQFAMQTTREVLEELRQERTVPLDAGRASAPLVSVLVCPARDELDALALEMVGQLVELDRCRVAVLGAAMLTSEMVEHVEQERPDVCCVGTVAPGGLNHTRHLVKRLRARCPDLKLVVGRFGLGDEREGDGPALIEAGADRVATTLLEARRQIAELSLLSGRAEAEDSGAQTVLGELVGDGAR